PLPNPQALKLRIYDEVRDEARDNPFGTLVRLGGLKNDVDYDLAGQGMAPWQQQMLRRVLPQR
ncbi:MAG: hypothetical protein M1420_06780, partial [Actinobacteria bacterium]|nr:hypothetical protein [Actinomycetota bacterium]